MRDQVIQRPDGTWVTHREKPSRKLESVRILSDGWDRSLGCRVVRWENDLYYGLVRHYEAGCPLAPERPYAILSLSAVNEQARHDFREYQQLKNMLLGEEWEGLELYPSESRLIDPSNRFYLWCFPPGVVPWGLPGKDGTQARDVVGHREALAPQRPFPDHVSE